MNAPLLFAVFLAVVALGLSCVLLFMVKTGSAASVTRVEELEGKIVPVDLIAFRNLVDRDETQALRDRLSPKVFVKIHRLRMRAAIAYVQALYRNAGITIRLAQQMVSSPDANVREQAQRIQQASIETRIYALQSFAKLGISFMFPTLRFSIQDLTASYVRIAERIESLCTLTAPLHTSRIAAAFR